jgi:hypothetical protein
MTLIHFSKLNELPPIKLSKTAISTEFLNKNITSFQQACEYIQKLPYGRHSKRDDFLAVLTDGKGSCTSKHGMAVLLANELNLKLKLICGIYYMTAKNTPKISSVLNNYDLNYIPEAHCFIKYQNQYFDITHTDGESMLDIVDFLEFNIDNIYPKKDIFHQTHIKTWVKNNTIPYTPEEIWKIREMCILALSRP